MTESEWMTSDRPDEMLRYLDNSWRGLTTTPMESSQASDRKLRLFVCACFRIRRHAFKEAAEYLYADDGRRITDPADMASRWASGEANLPPLTQEMKANLIRDICGNVFHPVTLQADCNNCKGRGWNKASEFGGDPKIHDSQFVCWKCKQTGKVAGRPHWLTKTVIALARAAAEPEKGRCERCGGSGKDYYAPVSQPLAYRDCIHCHGTGTIQTPELDAGRLAVLADCLEDCGCDSAAILGHLRSPGPHVVGCHVLDLLLGNS